MDDTRILGPRKISYTVDIQPCTLERSSNNIQQPQTDLDAISRNFIYEGDLTGSLVLEQDYSTVNIRCTLLSRGAYELDLTVESDEQAFGTMSSQRRQITRVVHIT